MKDGRTRRKNAFNLSRKLRELSAFHRTTLSPSPKRTTRPVGAKPPANEAGTPHRRRGNLPGSARSTALSFNSCPPFSRRPLEETKSRNGWKATCVVDSYHVKQCRKIDGDEVASLITLDCQNPLDHGHRLQNSLRCSSRRTNDSTTTTVLRRFSTMYSQLPKEYQTLVLGDEGLS